MRERNTETSPRRTTPVIVPRIPRSERAARSLIVRCLGSARLGSVPIVCALGLWHATSYARAQASSADATPTPRMVALVSGGVPLRLTLDRSLGQDRLGPLFGNILLGYVFPGARLQHGVGVGVSWNATHDGGYTTPVYALDQIALMPSYLAYYPLNPDLFGIAHVGLPVLVRGGPSAGLELGAALAYRATAGLGVFAGLDLNAHLALDLNVFASLELGVVVDYEVLP